MPSATTFLPKTPEDIRRRMPPSTANQTMDGNRHFDHSPEWIWMKFEAAQMEILDAQENIQSGDCYQGIGKTCSWKNSFMLFEL